MILPNIPSVAYIIPDLVKPKKAITMRKYDPTLIIRTVCMHLNIREDNVLGKRRFAEFVHARHIAMYILYMRSNITLKTIGKLFNCDHTSVISGKNTVLDMINAKYDNATKQDVNDILLRLDKGGINI